MHLRVPLLVTIAVGLAACADRAPTAVEPAGLAPTASPSFDKKTANPSIGPGNPGLISGNISGEGAAVCSAVRPSGTTATWLGLKIDGATGIPLPGVAGYTFTVTADGRFVSYSPIAGASLGTIVAVVVKGGPDTYVYYSPAANTQLRAPDNNGGNIPQISHYTVCYTPAPPPPWTVVKKLIQVYGGTADKMVALGTGQPVLVPHGEMRWLQFQIDVTGPTGGTATLQDLAADACKSIVALGFNCYLPPEYGGPGMGNYTYDGNAAVAGIQPIGPGTYYFMIDVANDGACNASGVITNTAQLTPTGGAVQQSTVQVQVQGGPCWKVEKKLLKVFAGTEANMIEVSTAQPLDMPKNQMRWLLFEITVSGPTGGTATLQDLAASACNQIKPLGFNCYLPTNISPSGGLIDYTFDGNPNVAGIQPIGPGKYQFMIDVIFEGNNCGVEGNLTNEAKLTPTAGGGALSSQAVVKVRGTCTTPS